MSSLANGSPNEGTGLPQYSQPRYARRLVAATSRQCRISRGQRSHSVIVLLSAASGASGASVSLLQFTR